MSTATSFFRALADTTRWRIAQLVMDQALCVCELADILGMPHSSVSSHVQVIRKAGLLESESCGKWTYYRIHPKHLHLLKSTVKHFPQDPQHHVDAQRAAARMAHRKSTCCPGPIKLSSTKRSAKSSVMT